MSELDFTIDTNILKDIIQKQSGTIQKALMEIIMNSIDAKAKNIIIKASAASITISDDGEGFRDKEEIVKYFGRFGTPHKEGDATFGRFRIGRGQLFSFGICSWRSASFEMTVDIKNNGFKYSLKENLPFEKGCIVECTFYDIDNDAFSNIYSIEKEVQFASCNITFNDFQITKDIGNMNWTHETNEYYYLKSKDKADESDEFLEVYNQGIYVKSFSPYSLGLKGLFLSKKALNVNFARNDIIEKECTVWKKFTEYIEKERLTNANKTKRTSNIIPKHERAKYINLALRDKLNIYEFCKLKVFEDLIKKKYSLFDLMDLNKNIFAAADSKYPTILMDALNQKRDILIFDKFTISSINESFLHLDYPIKGFEECIEIFKEQINSKLEELEFIGEVNYEFSKLIKLNNYLTTIDIHQQLKKLEELVDINYEHIPAKELTVKEKLLIKCLDEVSYHIVKLKRFSEARGKHLSDLDVLLSSYDDCSFEKSLQNNTRKIKVAETYAQEIAWTDGFSEIVFDRTFLNKSFMSIQNFNDTIAVMVHEYCHDENSLETKEHGVEFYEAFHNLYAKRFISKELTNELSSEKAFYVNRNAKWYLDIPTITTSSRIKMSRALYRKNEKLPSAFLNEAGVSKKNFKYYVTQLKLMNIEIKDRETIANSIKRVHNNIGGTTNCEIRIDVIKNKVSTAKVVIRGAISLSLELNLKKLNKAIDENLLDRYFIQLKDSMKLPFKVDYTSIKILDSFYAFKISTEMSNTFILDYHDVVKNYIDNADKESKKLISYLLKSYESPVLFEEDIEPEFMRQYYKNDSAVFEISDIIKSLDAEV